VTNELPAPNKYTRASDFVLGAFTLFAACGFIGTFLWLKAEPLWAPAQRINVMFHDVGGLNENAAVYTDGVRVGAVDRITLLGKHRVKVHMKINQAVVRVPQGAEFAIRTNGLVGARYVDITLPDHAGQPMTPDTVAWGEDPIRPELVVDRLALQLNEMDFKRMQDNLEHGMDRMSVAADNVSVLSRKLHPVADKAMMVEQKVALLAAELHGTSTRVNRLLQDPTLKRDMRDTLAKLNEMTAHVESTATKVQELATDPVLREDIKQVVGDARETVHEVHAMVNDPQFGSEMKSTMAEAHSALARLDTVGRQLNQILSKRAPLIQMLVGRPGKLKDEQTAGTNESVPQ
jgi:phospholipid/cholesterol/gamma-HCH transport system substrate-binding protein